MRLSKIVCLALPGWTRLTEVCISQELLVVCVTMQSNQSQRIGCSSRLKKDTVLAYMRVNRVKRQMTHCWKEGMETTGMHNQHTKKISSGTCSGFGTKIRKIDEENRAYDNVFSTLPFKRLAKPCEYSWQKYLLCTPKFAWNPGKVTIK